MRHQEESSMTALPSPEGGHGALHLLPDGFNAVSEFLAPAGSSGANKRKRRPAGTPDPGAEVVALSPKTLMESDRYVCEICNQGFQRDQNLQMHRRRHKLLKRPSLGTHKRVYVCPERSCLHHDPSHALGDLVGIKKHYRRKHCTEKQWKCDKCSKGYAVQSDYKAHLKTCGTRGHCCDCGRVFSRVESFIEHQDTCSAIKHKSMHSGGGSDKNLSLQHHIADRSSNDSPSQSSDTTQAVSFAQSGMSDTAARSADSIRVFDEQSRRVESSYRVMPSWLMERRNELDLMPSKPQLPDAYSEVFTSGAMQVIGRIDQPSYGSRSQVTRCSSMNSACPEVSCTDSRSLPPSLSSDDVNTPSLQLSIGPCSTEVASSSPCIDTKPSLGSLEREVLALTYQQTQAARSGEASAGIPRLGNSSPALGNDLALSIPASVAQTRNKLTEEHGMEAVTLSDFLIQAARRLGPSHTQSQPELNQTKKQMNIVMERGANFNPYAGSTSSFHEERPGRVHESDPSGIRMPKRSGSSQSSQGVPQSEPATSIITSRLALDQRDIAHTELFAASQPIDEAYRQKEMAASGCVEASQSCEQAKTDITSAWSDLAAARRTKEQARQESNEAQKELAKADSLKKEAREQLQLASAERAYADRAREVAKRQMEMSEADLATAKRLREHAQAELEKAQFLKERLERSMSTNVTSQEQLSYCHSCKSAIELSSRRTQASRTTPTPPSATWSVMTSPTALDQLQASASGSGQLFMNPESSSLEGARHAEHAADPNKLYSSRTSWSDTVCAPMPMSSGERSHPWLGNSNVHTFATSIAIEGSPQSESTPVGEQLFSHAEPAQSDRGLKNSKNLDLN